MKLETSTQEYTTPSSKGLWEVAFVAAMYLAKIRGTPIRLYHILALGFQNIPQFKYMIVVCRVSAIVSKGRAGHPKSPSTFSGALVGRTSGLGLSRAENRIFMGTLPMLAKYNRKQTVSLFDSIPDSLQGQASSDLSSPLPVPFLYFPGISAPKPEFLV